MDVLADGNCGFRAAAVSMGKSAEEWINIRKDMISEMDSKDSIYQDEDVLDNLWGKKVVYLRERLDHTSGPCGVKFWMHFPTHGYLLADTYRRPVILFSKQGSATYLPLCHPPTTNPPVCVFFLSDLCHLISFHFKSNENGSPYPAINPFWKHHAREDAKPWEEKIVKNLLLYQNLFKTRRATRAKSVVIDLD